MSRARTTSSWRPSRATTPGRSPPSPPDGLHDELAREVAAFLDQSADTITVPQRSRGPVVWLALLPAGIPLLAVLFGRSIGGLGGFLIWGVLAGLLALACLLIVLQ